MKFSSFLTSEGFGQMFGKLWLQFSIAEPTMVDWIESLFCLCHNWCLSKPVLGNLDGMAVPHFAR